MATSINGRELRLRFVPANEVLLHEETDPLRVDRLAAAIDALGVLKNPPIVAPTSDGRYVVLDGATRTTVLKMKGASDIIVQVVPYSDPGVDLEAWYHVLPDVEATNVLDFARTHTEMAHTASVDEARSALDERSAIAAIVNDDATAMLVHGNASTLRQLVKVYGGAGEIFRIVHDDLVDTVRRMDRCPSVVMFPTFTPSEIDNYARSNELLPAGITRHLIPGRALNINVGLEHFTSTKPLAEKNEWLNEWLTSKIMAKKVRYYHEPVFVFDD